MIRFKQDQDFCWGVLNDPSSQLAYLSPLQKGTLWGDIRVVIFPFGMRGEVLEDDDFTPLSEEEVLTPIGRRAYDIVAEEAINTFTQDFFYNKTHLDSLKEAILGRAN